jgi:hypothetical protein
MYYSQPSKLENNLTVKRMNSGIFYLSAFLSFFTNHINLMKSRKWKIKYESKIIILESGVCACVRERVCVHLLLEMWERNNPGEYYNIYSPI